MAASTRLRDCSRSRDETDLAPTGSHRTPGSVESRCDAAAVGWVCPLPPRSSGGALLTLAVAPSSHPAHRTRRADLPQQMSSITFDAGKLHTGFGGWGRLSPFPTLIQRPKSVVRPQRRSGIQMLALHQVPAARVPTMRVARQLKPTLCQRRRLPPRTAYLPNWKADQDVCYFGATIQGDAHGPSLFRPRRSRSAVDRTRRLLRRVPQYVRSRSLLLTRARSRSI